MNQITTTTTKENNKVDTKIFNFNGQDVRVLGTQDEPLFVARDVALILGYSDSQAMTRRIDADDLRTCTDKSSGQAREVSALTESGLYSAILGSTKPEAKAFKRCVTSEILPSIRKHGIYATAPTIEAMLNDPDVMIKTLTALKEERIAKVNAQLEAKEAQKALALESAAKQQVAAEKEVVVAEKEVVEKKLNSLGTAVRSLYTAPTGTSTVRDCAKFFSSRGWNVSESTLRKTLQEKGWLTKGKGPTATASAISTGYMAAGEVVTNHATGWSGEVKTPKITGKGFTKITVSLKDWGYSQMADDDCTLALGF